MFCKQTLGTAGKAPTFFVTSYPWKEARREKRTRVGVSPPTLAGIAGFLQKGGLDGPSSNVLGRVASPSCVYLCGEVLHIHVLRLSSADDLIAIQLYTSLRIVKKVKIHTLHFNYFHPHSQTKDKTYLRVQIARWEGLRLVLSSICSPVKRGRYVKLPVLLDRNLRIIVKRYREHSPVVALLEELPREEWRRVTTHLEVPWWVHGYHRCQLGRFVYPYMGPSIDTLHNEHEGFTDEEPHKVVKVGGQYHIVKSRPAPAVYCVCQIMRD